MKTLLFIPAYNCARQLDRVFDRFTQENVDLFDELLVIDNFSRDETRSVLHRRALDFRETFNKKVHVVLNSTNLGFGGSHKKAFQLAIEMGFENCIVLHGDDQARLDDLLQVDFRSSSSMLFGSRFSLASKRMDYSTIRTFGNIFFNTLFSIKFLRVIPDIGGSGLNVYNLQSYQALVDESHPLPDDLTFHAELLNRVYKSGHRPILYFPIQWFETDQISNVRMVSQTINLFRIFLH